MLPSELTQKFDYLLPFLRQLKKYIFDTISPFAERHEFPFYGRIKTVESLAEKIETGRYRKFSDLDDLVAFTLIIPTATHEIEVLDFCRKSFNVIKIRSKENTDKSPDRFRFDSTRVIGKAKPTTGVDTGQPSLFNILFEIQIRTAFEHAWSVATHDLVYKGSLANWKSLRLAAQLKAVSESLDASVAAFDELSKGIVESPSRQVAEKKLVCSFLVELFQRSTMPTEMAPLSFSRTAENLATIIKTIHPQEEISDVIHFLNDKFDELDRVPVSTTLYQLTLGMLCSNPNYNFRTNRISCHITDELLALFPESRRIADKFAYAE
jgi:ppGpp synthetase/RelA/SpoT-type nucleotidyltranferase